MIQLNEQKLAKLKTTNQLLDEKYGKHGTPTRDAFNEKNDGVVLWRKIGFDEL